MPAGGEGRGAAHPDAGRSCHMPTSVCCRSARPTENRQAKCGCPLVKIRDTRFTSRNLPGNPPPNPTDNRGAGSQHWLRLRLRGSLAPPPISRHFRHILYVEMLPTFGLRIQSWAVFYGIKALAIKSGEQSTILYSIIGSTLAIHGSDYVHLKNEKASFRHSLFLLPLKEGDPL